MAKEIKHRKARKVKMVRIAISIPEGLLGLTDRAAEEDFTSRSDIIRAALVWYLQPQGRQLKQVDPEEILKTLKRRKELIANRQLLKDLGNSYED